MDKIGGKFGFFLFAVIFIAIVTYLFTTFNLSLYLLVPVGFIILIIVAWFNKK